MATFHTFHKWSVLFNLKQNWPSIFRFFEFHFYRLTTEGDFLWIENIFLPVFHCRTGEPSFTRIQKKLLAVDRKGFSLPYFSSHLFLSARYRPFQSSWRRGLFPQQFQHSTPTTPSKGVLVAGIEFSRLKISQTGLFRIPVRLAIL
jgi:hypothetical protein